METDFNVYREFIIGDEIIYSDSIKFIIYSNHSPLLKEKIIFNNETYVVDTIDDVTTYEEFEDGLSYVEVKMIKE